MDFFLNDVVVGCVSSHLKETIGSSAAFATLKRLSSMAILRFNNSFSAINCCSRISNTHTHKHFTVAFQFAHVNLIHSSSLNSSLTLLFPESCPSPSDASVAPFWRTVSELRSFGRATTALGLSAIKIQNELVFENKVALESSTSQLLQPKAFSLSLSLCVVCCFGEEK